MHLASRSRRRCLRAFSILAVSLLMGGCDEPTGHYLLYPVQASKQELLRIEGYRFLSSVRESPASILVLSNPVENGGFADLVFSLTNNSNKPLHLNSKDLAVKMSKRGTLEVISNDEYISAQTNKRPDGFERLSPKMQAFGCAAANTKDNITPSSFNASQSWVWEKHLRYPFKQEALYFKTLDIPSGETKGALFRVRFPELAKDFEQATVLIHLKMQEDEGYKFKFILQSLQ